MNILGETIATILVITLVWFWWSPATLGKAARHVVSAFQEDQSCKPALPGTSINAT